MSSTAPESPRALWRMGNLLVWLGGGEWRDITDHSERSSYASTGFIVLLNAVIAWGVATFAVVGLTGANALLALPFTLVCGLLVGAFGRVLATRAAEPGGGWVLGDVARALVAVLIGVVVGELAALAIFTGPTNRELNEQVDVARASVAQSERGRELERLQDDRQRLDAKVATAQERRDEALVVARCETNPTPACPSDRITGAPGRGYEANVAERELGNAEQDLADARAERTDSAPRLDARITQVEGLLDADRVTAEALARADTGLDARWRAMHDYTTGSPVAGILRLAVVTFFVVLSLLPLLLRFWRGQTEQDRRIAARRLRTRAEEEADTAIAVRRAEVRAARELREQEALLEAPPVEPARLTTATAERTEPLALPSAGQEPATSDNLPVLAERRELEPKRSGPLDSLPGPLPMVARALTGAVRPLVPESLARIASDAPRPARIARTLLEEVEEFSFSLTRKRKVTVTEETPDGPRHPGEESVEALRRSAVATRILDEADDRRAVLERDENGPALTAAELRARRELGLGDEPVALPYSEHRELPTGARRALPPGTDE